MQQKKNNTKPRIKLQRKRFFDLDERDVHRLRADDDRSNIDRRQREHKEHDRRVVEHAAAKQVLGERDNLGTRLKHVVARQMRHRLGQHRARERRAPSNDQQRERRHKPPTLRQHSQ